MPNTAVGGGRYWGGHPKRLAKTHHHWMMVWDEIGSLIPLIPEGPEQGKLGVCIDTCDAAFLCLYENFFLQALAVVEYLLANGSERAMDDILEHSFQISVRLLFYICLIKPSVMTVVSLSPIFRSFCFSDLISFLKSLSGFEYVEPNGKDMGINVRKKVGTIMTLLNDKDKIQEVRNKAAANRDK